MQAIEALPIFAAALDRSAGQAAAEACTAKAERVAAFDTTAAKAEILKALASAGRPMSGEELVDHCQRAGIVPHDARAFGSVFKALSGSGLIEAVGYAARRKGHGTAGARLWKSTGGAT
jgi:hypothetical protein